MDVQKLSGWIDRQKNEEGIKEEREGKREDGQMDSDIGS